MYQVDGENVSIDGELSDNDFDTEDEVDNEPKHHILVSRAQQGSPDYPLKLEVETTGTKRQPVRLSVVTNPRSIYYKLKIFATHLLTH